MAIEYAERPATIAKRTSADQHLYYKKPKTTLAKSYSLNEQYDLAHDILINNNLHKNSKK